MIKTPNNGIERTQKAAPLIPDVRQKNKKIKKTTAALF